MNEAQKFLLNNECDDLRLKEAQKVEDWIYASDMMERYHQDQVKKITIPDVVGQSEQFSLADMKKAFKEDSEEQYECEAHEIGQSCHCRKEGECRWRKYKTFEEWWNSQR